jgi:outer membrane protein assembly factor BamB
MFAFECKLIQCKRSIYLDNAVLECTIKKGEEKNMKISRSKTTATLIALILMFAMAISLVALPAANAHTPPWEIKTYAYLNLAPDHVGVGQPIFVVMWSSALLPGAALTNDIRMQGYTVTVTKPNNKTETLGPPGGFTADPTSTIYTTYTPDQAGTYSFVFSYPDLVYSWSGSYNNDVFLGATSKTMYLTVQEEPMAETPTYPLPTEYWTRPIEGRNTNWFSISSNWLGTGAPPIATTNFQRDGIAPNSAHIMWTKPIQEGGVVGGTNVGPEGNTFYMGGSYNHRFRNPIIMYGRLYYEEPFGLSGTAGGEVCVDLRTGEEIWRRDDVPPLSFGYYYDADTPNQHGVFYEGILFTSNFREAYDPRTGNHLFTVTGVPPGDAVIGPSGEILRYTISNAGNDTNPNWRLAQWNSSKLWNLLSNTPTIPSTVDASTAERYDWNVSIPWRNGMSSVDVVAVFLDDIMLGRNGTLPAWSNDASEYTMWAISLKPESRGQLLWMKTYPAPSGDVSILIRPETVDSETRIFTIYEKETMNWYGYGLDDGLKKWGPVANLRAFDYFSGSVATENTGSHHVAYGNLYVSGYGGVLSCIDLLTGERKWTYGNGGAGNSTFSGLESPWGNFPLMIGVIADGKIYLFTNEHSPNTPQYKGALIRCVNATTGEEIWTLSGWGEGGSFMSNNGAIADGYYTYLNTYDMQIYCIGKGPSATTVTASPKVSVHGSSVLIEGAVIDTAAGTKQDEQAARFPNGVPAVSDANMTAWMEYVYQQKPLPTDAVGVEVVLEVLDPNNNYYEVGRTTSDASGMFHCAFTPEVSGEYTIIATFEGSESYWPSYAETAINVEDAPAATPAPTPTPAPMTDTYVMGFGIGIIIAIVIGFALLLLRKRP